jgi:hypothetical protein
VRYRYLTIALMLFLVSLPVMAQQATDTAAAETDTTATTTTATTTAATETAAAPKTEPAAAGAAQVVKVGVSLTNLGKLDLATGTYNVEFYLSFTCPAGVTNCSTDFALDSGVVTKSEKVPEETPGKTVFRVKADMTEDLNLSEYPLDEHELTISFTHPTEDASKLVYAIDKDNTSVGDAVKLAGFDIIDSGGNVETKKFDGVDENFSVYTFHITARRVRLSSYLKGFLPPFFIVLVACLGLVLRAKSITNRLTMGTACLLSAVMFHISSTSALPPLGYLTRADKFMLVTYVILVVNLLFCVLIVMKDDKKDEAGTEKAYKTALFGLPLLALVVYLVVLLKIF